MDQIVHRVLRFDRFALDLTRGCLRTGDQDIDLRPKAFEVLHYLAENAGRLVSKQELYEVVWPNVIVSDDSLVQCIRELRRKLDDREHRLIKTVSRRGYLLDSAVSGPESPSEWSAPKPPEESPKIVTEEVAPQPVGSSVLAHRQNLWRVVAAIFVGAMLAAIYLLGWPHSIAGPGHVSLAEDALVAAEPRPVLKDCEDCPEMVMLPAGEFMMGSPQDERNRLQIEGLPRHVTIAKPFAMGKFEVTVDQFSAFVADTGMAGGNQCRVMVEFDRGSPVWGPPNASFREPGFEVTGTQPVVCINWHDAQAYVAWLKRRTGKPYRLPTEAEWEYAARANTGTRYGFGSDETELCGFARFADLGSRYRWHGACRGDTDAYGPLPVGQLKPNAWGIFDMHGNAWEWVEDCWTPNTSEIPADGSAFSRPGKCEVGVIRGGSFASGPGRLRSATRWPVPAAAHYHHYGFRVALSLGE
jgi:formylglycine-generating enzyme required for sulfatase activity/DNA-binding winged helix-turn-helix (wHTH) protein